MSPRNAESVPVDPFAAERLPRMVQRLTDCGATPDEIVAFTDSWLDPETWDHEQKVVLLAMGDAHLTAAILDARATSEVLGEDADDDDQANDEG